MANRISKLRDLDYSGFFGFYNVFNFLNDDSGEIISDRGRSLLENEEKFKELHKKLKETTPSQESPYQAIVIDF